MRTQDGPFFVIVAGDNAGENYLSRVFQACFANSLCFREIVLRTIWKVCELPTPFPNADSWESWLRKSAQGAKWSFCLTAGKIVPRNQERR